MDHPIEAHSAHPQRRARLGIESPLWSTVAIAVLGLFVMTGVMTAIGYFITHVLTGDPVGAWDNGVNQWFVAQRTQGLNAMTAVGSMLGATLPVIGIAVLAAIGLAIAKRWRAVGFLAVGLFIEVGAFLITAVVIDRPRPTVPRLDVAPPTSSFPSGHAAAAIVLYVGLAVIVWSLTRAALLRTASWAIAVGIPVFVGLSRIYRGMHHTTDVIGSVILAIGALLFAHSAVGPLQQDPR